MAQVKMFDNTTTLLTQSLSNSLYVGGLNLAMDLVQEESLISELSGKHFSEEQILMKELITGSSGLLTMGNERVQNVSWVPKQISQKIDGRDII